MKRNEYEKLIASGLTEAEVGKIARDQHNKIYVANGYKNREDYLQSLCEEHDSDAVYGIAELLGRSEDFDGLITSLEDYEMGGF